MTMQSIKYLLWIFLFFLVFILFNSWKNEKVLSDDLSLSSELFNVKTKPETVLSDVSIKSISSDNNIFIKTNLVDARINTITGDIVYLSLKKYFKDLSKVDNVCIFDQSDNRFYYPQIGVLSEQFSCEKIDFSSLVKVGYDVKEDDVNLFVILKYESDKQVFVYKVYTFKTYSYEINLDFYIQNNGFNDINFKHYGLIRYKNISFDNSFLNSGIRAYEGGAVYTVNKPYKKLSFDELNNNNFYYSSIGGWVAFLERYFISAFIPDMSNEYVYFAERCVDDFYSFKYVNSNDVKISSGECICLKSVLFAGPKSNNYLNNLSKGLELTIDYGIFWPISSPIFFLLSYIYSFFSNWGLSIVLVTFLIKLLFFNLSSISYKSMGNMKKLQPRLELLKEQFKNDRTQFGNAVMTLYKKENVNPLSGCLPVLIQIPVFISLYYVLLESIELRHAPFIFWINDLSSKDIYYVLPVIMSLTMFIQQKMNPPMQDKFQEKVMMFLPFIFLFLFLQFPSGLILYWIVNNLLSILQQWFIMKRVIL